MQNIFYKRLTDCTHNWWVVIVLEDLYLSILNKLIIDFEAIYRGSPIAEGNNPTRAGDKFP